MTGPDFKTVVESIRDHNEIADVIGSYVQLKRAGRALKACCPFHKEKTPSFHVNQARQSFHCFGCGAGGDVFSFIMKYENVDFMEAARMLAERAHLPFEFDRSAVPGDAARKQDLLALHAQAASWYRECLLKSGQAEKARAYLRDRELDDATAEQFGIGYAPATGVDWERWAGKRKFDMALLEAAGIVIRREQGGWYDRFSDRLMFPISDESGRVIGFSGRILPGDERPAKYVNSPETPLFTKSRVIYALHHAKREILDRNEAVLCEGQIDVIRCHMAGIKNAVAAQGTAVTEEHARILRRLTDTVRLVLDSDNAGRNAAMRSADLLIGAGLNVLVASLPAGDDPDSMIRRDGGEAFLTALDQAAPALDFQIETLMSREPQRDNAALLRVARAALESIAQAPSDIQRDKMIQRASDRLGLRPDILASEFRMMSRRRTRATATDEPAAPADAGTITHAREELETIRLLIHHRASAAHLARYLMDKQFTSETCRMLFKLLIGRAEDAEVDLMAELPSEATEARRIVAMLSAEDRFASEEFDLEKSALELSIALWRRQLENRRRAFDEERRTAPPERAAALEMEITEITIYLHTLRANPNEARKLLELLKNLPEA